MLLYKLSDLDVGTLSISNAKNTTYLQANKENFELQTDWITLGKYALPSKKFVSDDAKSINLTVLISKGDIINKTLSDINNYLSNLSLIPNKNYHGLISEKDESYFLKFKIYLDTALFDKNKNRISITSLFDFYRYLKEDTQLKLVFRFSKMWRMSNSYGFSMSVRRILLKDEIKEAPETTVNFIDE